MGKILVVDDQFGVRRLLVEAFQDDGYEVKMAANGEAALHLLLLLRFYELRGHTFHPWLFNIWGPIRAIT